MTTKVTFKVAAMCGSLRENSYNRSLLRAVGEEAPEGFEIHDLPSLQDVPPFNQDLINPPFPPIIQRFMSEIRSCDAVMIATPELNYGVPGILKNAIDWLSCPATKSVFRYKPVSIIGASIGNFGTLRAQLSLRQTLLFLDSHVVTKPEIYLIRAHEKFTVDGQLVDDEARSLIRLHLAELHLVHEMTHRHRNEILSRG